MDPWLLGLILGYKDLPERAGELWDLMRDKREQIAHELTHKNRELVLSVHYNALTPLELEFRMILIRKELESIPTPKKRKGSHR